MGEPEEAIPIFSTLCVAFYDCMLQTKVDFHSYYVMKSKDLVDIDEFTPYLEDATFQIEYRGETLDLSHILPEKFMTTFTGPRFSMKQFEVKKTIGKGGYAEVFLGSHKVTKEQYAIKELIDPEEMKYDEMASAKLKGKLQFRTFHQMGKEFKHEIGIQGSLAHPNILQIKGIGMIIILLLFDYTIILFLFFDMNG
jgi:serine/threonine protein kinase